MSSTRRGDVQKMRITGKKFSFSHSNLVKYKVLIWFFSVVGARNLIRKDLFRKFFVLPKNSIKIIIKFIAMVGVPLDPHLIIHAQHNTQ